jgi:hypothetical protein
MYQRFARRMRERAAEHRCRAGAAKDADARALHLDLAEEFAARAEEVERVMPDADV